MGGSTSGNGMYICLVCEMCMDDAYPLVIKGKDQITDLEKQQGTHDDDGGKTGAYR